MKKLLCMCITAALAFMAGCGEYVPPQSVFEGASGHSGYGSSASGGTDSAAEGLTFTLTLMLDGEPYSPTLPITASWTGTGGVFSAPVDEGGKAVIEGLDGDYQVTISPCPIGLTYDPNIYVADNDSRDTVIEMLHIIPVTGQGGMYSARVITREGVYRTVLTAEGEEIFYEYRPAKSGSFSIESIVDITSNDVNPIADIYNGTEVYKNFYRTQDDGGSGSTYCKNFKLVINAAQQFLGNVWTFVIKATCRSGNYPVTVDFMIRFDGEYEVDSPIYNVISPCGPYMNGAEISAKMSGTERYAYSQNDRILDGRLFRKYEDGFYRFYDEATDTYGPYLFAVLSRDTEVLSTNSGMGFFDVDVQRSSFRLQGEHNVFKNYESFLLHYNDLAVNGVYPLNEELRQYLQDFSVSQRYFMDGYGWPESYISPPLSSDEKSQWLFNCVYYS